MKQFSILILCLCAFSCKKNQNLVQYQDGKQMLTMNHLSGDGIKLPPPEIGKISKDSILINEELLVKVFLKNSDLKIVEAFAECEEVPDPLVDTTTYKVSGCSKALIVRNDTVYIGLRSSEAGVKTFPDITILTRDKNRIFRTVEYSFKYVVVSNNPLSMQGSFKKTLECRRNKKHALEITNTLRYRLSIKLITSLG